MLRAFIRPATLAASLLAAQACFVDGSDILGPESPDYATVCADSVASDSVPCLENNATINIQVTYHRYPWETR